MVVSPQPAMVGPLQLLGFIDGKGGTLCFVNWPLFQKEKGFFMLLTMVYFFQPPSPAALSSYASWKARLPLLNSSAF